MVDAVQAIGTIDALYPEAAANGVPEHQEQNAFIDILSRIDATVADANNALATVAKGESDAPIHELMIALEVSRLQLQMLVEVRNRVVEGYQELTRMQV